MIVDLNRFIQEERPHWERLEAMLEAFRQDPEYPLTLREARRLHYLYERASTDLAKLGFLSERAALRTYLEQLVAGAYAQIHETQRTRTRFRPHLWFAIDFPRVFRRHIRAFQLSVLLMLVGSTFGGVAVLVNPTAKQTFFGSVFQHLQETPAERVAREEQAQSRHSARPGASAFSAYLARNNIQVAIFTLALGMTYGIGTAIILFYNGVILGAVFTDYVAAGQAPFVVGWLLPHGSVEIPAILIAGQASLLLAGALIGRGSRLPLGRRLRSTSRDLAVLVFGIAVLLLWAALVEAFFSQYHEPLIPYSLKIGFGIIELAVLAVFLAKAGPVKPEEEETKT